MVPYRGHPKFEVNITRDEVIWEVVLEILLPKIFLNLTDEIEIYVCRHPISLK